MLHRHRRMISRAVLMVGLCGGAFIVSAAPQHDDDTYWRKVFDVGSRYSKKVEFPQTVGSRGDVTAGQGNFGVASDGVSSDQTTALFEGPSAVYEFYNGGPVVSDGRTCFTCHRPGTAHFGLPPLPLDSTVPADDPLFTGLQADIGDEPLGLQNFNEKGLLFHRPGRFNPTLAANDPFKQVFFWRRSTRLLNTVFTFGILNDGRMRELVEAVRGAVFTHTQNTDVRFDDIADVTRLQNISAFIEDQVDPPELRALLDPNDPLYSTLVNDPFYTVHASTPAEKRGQDVFRANCMDCHNTPNVFGNIEHQDGPPLNFPPHYGRPFDIGVAQRNKFNLEFRRFDTATGQRVPIVLPLAREDGTVIQHTVTDDIGMAAASGRYDDLHRFKVPQLRKVRELGPYFHDNSAATLEEVVDYFNSPNYNQSADGSQHPIHLNAQQRADLLAFLNIL